jgi:hypothetical protein
MLAVLAVENELVSVQTTDREIPGDIVEEAVVVPTRALTAQFTAGPNPVSRGAGIVSFFRQGKRFENATLTIFDATGNVVSRVSVSDKAIDGHGKRLVGSWDLRDARGRPVSEGTYLVRGVLTTIDGSREQVSVVVGVR